MNSRMFFAAVAVLSVIVLAALSAALPSALLPGNTAYAQTNSAPQFPSSETGTRTVDENTPWYQNIGDPVVATDPDDDKLTYSLENARTSPFTIDRFTGQLQTGAPLDYETKATYTAKVIAADRLEPDDPSRATDTITVTINVNNVDEPGKVSLTWTRLQVGAEVEASLTDPDGNVSGVTWRWEKSSDESSWTAISTATQASYTPVEGDVNRYLRAVASYTDPLGAGKTAWSAAAYVKPVPHDNQTPEFQANTGGGYDCTQGETAKVCLYIKRHAPPSSEIYYPSYVDNTDNDQVRYSIDGADAVKFRIGPLSGDLYTTDAHAYDNPGTDGIFEITLTATDPSGLSGSIDVALRPSGSAGSPTVRGPEEIRYPENGTWPLATYSATASNPDRDIHGWIISIETGGGGGDFFDIDNNGVLTFTQPPDYEDQADENGDNTYSFTIMAYDTSPPNGRRPGRTSFRVRVTVADVNEPPEFDSATATREVPENTEAGENIGDPVTAADPDTGDTPAYTLEGADLDSFDIDSASGQIQTKPGVNYDHESKSSYTVTVTASDGALTAAVDVTVTVTNIDEAGTVTLSTDQPPARAEITAALTDPDEGVTGAVWQWERSGDGNTGWAGIGTGSPSYTPVAGDVGYHLRATASYTDGHGPGKTAQAASTQAVQAGANRPPEFDSATATREVPENTEAGENIGAPVTAADPDTGDTPAYTLEGADLDSFDIDSASGQIQTKPGVTYDHESKSSYSVTVKADDNNGGTATIDVTITVADVNEPPEFSVETASRTIAENTTTGVAIGAPVTATDPDTGDTPAYTLEGADLDSFDIDSASGQIQTKSGVTYDHEIKSSYSVTVKADDNNGGTATIDVTITVADVNEPPEFSVETASRTIAENTTTGVAIGAPVTATDPDTGDTPAYTLEGADLDSFDIDSASGQIQTKSGVTYDHEVKSSYSVTVKADDNNGGTATIDVTITVADVNEPPEFDSATATREVPENTEAGGNIGAPVTATDPDTGDTPAYTLEGADLDSFDIDSASGQIQTKPGVTYDHESKSSYTVTVTASDGALTATVDVTVTVTNIDEAGTVALSTNQPPARAEITAALTDPDEGVTGAVWQWERSSDGNTDWAGIGTSSPSYTPVDGDVGYHLRATASYTDGHGPGKTAQAASTQAVQAGANRPPEFDSATATREVPENTEAGENIGTPVTATDPDTGDTPAYTLEGADLDSFDIDSASGQIQTKSGVNYDHEVKSSYSVTVKADDNNGGTATIDVTITVADVNEPPEFSVETASRTIAENTTTGVAIGAPVTATDPDTGDTPAYTLEGADLDSFDIDSASGQIQTKSGVTYDHESKSSYSVTVKADDNNGGTATIDVTITVADVNEPPEFSVETASREVPENTEAGGNIGAPVTATDPDTGDTPAYTLEGADLDSFDIDSASGQIQTKPGVTYDHESKSSYTVTVTASDGALTATVDVTVTVTNIDEAGTVALSTNQPPARAEITAALTDPDEGVTGAVWQWERSSDGNTDWAGIGTSSPSYTPVDGDVGYHLRATASYTDGHGPGKTAQAASTQAVQAGANRPPEFDSATATREVPENTEAGENIGTPVTATDPDTGDTPAYTLEGADLDSFDIDSASGQIQTKSGVNYDHEVKSSYSVTVKADDNNGGTATIDVTITVADVNEPPEFSVETASRTIAENTTTGVAIGAPVTATDPDTGDTPAYTLEGADLDSFDIDSASGQIQTKSGVTYDHEIKSSYSVTVKADDNNGGTATIDVTITVADVNEPPEFSVETASRTIAENTTTGVAIGAPVTATDPDTGDTPAYTLEGADLDSFDIDSASGQIQTKSGVTYDHEIKSSYSVTVKADDNNGGTATIDVTITVADVNEPPEFDSATATREVPENTEAGGNIGAPVTAADPDTGDTPAYTLEGADLDSFDIDSASGQLQTQAALDYETKSSYTVTVTASDGALTATVDVTVTVTNIDEAGTVALSTNQPPARAEITAALTDPDEGVTGAVWQWERSSDGNTDWAGIGTSSPSYTPVDGDVGYHLRARASYTDGHGPGKTAQAASTQAVQAGANRPPEFDSATATREVPENTEAGENIGAPVTATDPDNDTLTYTLGGADASSFDIGRSTGQITVGAGTALDYAAGASYTVSVTAADPSGSSAAIGVTIAVFAEDLGELGSRYDTDNDKRIGRDEVIAAIIEHFADRITRDELLEVVTLYLPS